MTPQEKPKRAITLAGGGPTAGIHLGILKYFREKEMEFDVWALSCIGAWVGVVYNQCDKGKEIEQTVKFFKDGVFRDDAAYSNFPINSVFGPDWLGYTQALLSHLCNLDVYRREVAFLLGMPGRVNDAVRQALLFVSDPKRQTRGDWNQFVLNHLLAVNPLVRFVTSTMFLSPLNGLARVYYPDSKFLRDINFLRLREESKPFIYHNAWNLDEHQLELFSNRDPKDKTYQRIDAQTLCACSALPFIEPTVEMNGHTYCEGALVDTVNFRNLVEEHNYVDEIWVSRIVEKNQVRAPQNLTDGLGNLCQLFAATVGEDDIALFRYHVKEDANWSGTLVEIQVPSEFIDDDGRKVQLNFDWSHANLENCMNAGYRAAEAAHQLYKDEGHPKELGRHRPPPGEIRHIRVDKEFGRVPTKSQEAEGLEPERVKAGHRLPVTANY